MKSEREISNIWPRTLGKYGKPAERYLKPLSKLDLSHPVILPK